jgi:hypothetical protein
VIACMIDGRPAEDFTDAELEALLARIAAKADVLADQQLVIGAILAGRRARAEESAGPVLQAAHSGD